MNELILILGAALIATIIYLVAMLRERRGAEENRYVRRGRKVVRELAETFKERTKLALTTAVAYMLWHASYRALDEFLKLMLPAYSGLFHSLIELCFAFAMGIAILYLISKWR